MKARRIKAQEAMEFVLITALVFFGALFSLLVFSDKIAAFFKTDSSVAKSSMADPNVLSSSSTGKFTPDYALLDDSTSNKDLYDQQSESLAEVSVTPATEGTVNITIGDVEVKNVPEDLSAYIKTTGASGGTQQISSTIEPLIADLREILAADPGNKDLQEIINAAQQIADSGYLVADAEEWFETAAKRLESKSSQDVPEDNLLCENGQLRNQVKSCDYTVVSENFFFGSSSTLNKLLDTNLKTLNDSNTKLQKLSNTQDLQKVKDVAYIIEALTSQINEIADNVKATAKDNKQKVANLKALQEGVASKTTDLKSRLIEKFGAKLKHPENSEKLPADEPVAADDSSI